MVILTLLEKSYGKEKTDLFVYKGLTSITSGLKIQLKHIGKTERGWTKIEIVGEDEKILINYLKKNFGLAPIQLKDVHASMIFKGKIIDSGKVGYGLYIDIGITTPQPIDALIPLYKLRSQLSNNKRVSVHKIIKDFCLYTNFPLEITLTKVDLNRKIIEAELSDKQLKVFRDWLLLGLDRVVALGATIHHIKRAVYKSKLYRDVINITPLGLLEQVLVCKLGTDAPGIITKIGPYLAAVPLHAFSPNRIK